MRVVTAEPARRTPALSLHIAPRERHRAHVEAIALAVTTRDRASVSGSPTGSSSPRSGTASAGAALVDLNRRRRECLAPALTVFPTAAERDSPPTRSPRACDDKGPLTHVGALTSVTVSAAEVRRNRRLATLNARLRGIVRAPRGRRLHRRRRRRDEAETSPFARSEEYRRGIGYIALVFVAAFWLVHLVRRISGRTGDILLLPAVQLLSGLGLMAMIALRDPLRDTDAGLGFVHGVALGCLALCRLSFVDFENPRFRRATVVPFAAAVGLAARARRSSAADRASSGVKVNLLGVQPIEAIRLLAVLALASYFSRRWELLRELSSTHGPTPAVRRFVKLPRVRDVQPLAVMLGVLFLFFFAQRDLGPALVLGVHVARVVRRGARAGGAGARRVAGARRRLHRCLLDRRAGHARTPRGDLAGSLGQCPDRGRSDRPCLVGHGLGRHRRHGRRGGDGYLVPAGQTDLILSVVGEELGLVGRRRDRRGLRACSIWRMLRIAARAPGDYTAFLALGCALSLAVPAIIIVGGELGALPLSGVATPFLTFGKSSMVANFAAAGIALAIGTRLQPRAAAARAPAAAARLDAGARRRPCSSRRATWVQAARADDIALRPTIVRDADGEVRYRYNPRLLAALRG